MMLKRESGLNLASVNSGAPRSGLTALEFVGCAIAVVGGVWLGALYLGVDVRHVVHTALAEADLLEKVPPKLRPAGPQEQTMTREELLATLRTELGAVRTELALLRAGGGVSETPPTPSDAVQEEHKPLPPPASKEKTLAYWNRVSDIALSEAALQQDAESAANASNAARVFAIKGRISRFAAKSVEAVSTEGVEDSVLQFGRQLGLWYTRAGELYERAVRIWETPTISQNREQLNAEWRRAEKHHNNEAELIKEKATAVREMVSRLFGEEFPEFAQSATNESVPPAAE